MIAPSDLNQRAELLCRLCSQTSHGRRELAPGAQKQLGCLEKRRAAFG
jgi:hypothetical protein